jgi:hypothetical protein
LAGAVEVGVARRQVFDLPPVRIRVIEHQVVARQCVCGVVTCGVAPEGIDAPVQYGPRIAAIVVYLYVGQFLSRKRTAQALAELFDLPLSAGHGHVDDPARRRWSERVPGVDACTNHRLGGGALRRDRLPGRRPAAVGALRLNREVLADRRARQARPGRDVIRCPRVDRQADYLRFATDFRVPFDNNAAEREIRMIRLREKVSGYMRTFTGAQDFAAIRSYLATAAKHGIGFLHALTELVTGHPWLPHHHIT